MKIISGLYFLGFALFFSACDYEPSGQYYKQIEPSSSKGITIDLSLQGDTITLLGNATFQFSTESKKPIVGATYYFDKVAHEISDYSFNLFVEGFNTGYYPLELKVVYAADNGSIADLSGDEMVSVTRSWIVHVDKELPTPVAFTNVSANAGALRVSWNKSDDPNFQYYQLRKYCFNLYSKSYVLCDTLVVSDRNTNFVEDLGFIGGQAKYRLQVVSRNRLSPLTDTEYISEWQPEITWTWTDAQNARGTWRKNPFYKSIKEITFGVAYRNGAISKTDPNDTSFAYTDANFNFGKEIDYELKVIGKMDDDPLVFPAPLFKGKACHRLFASSRYNSQTGLYYNITGMFSVGKVDTLYVFTDANKITPFKIIPLPYGARNFSFSNNKKELNVLYDSPNKTIIDRWDAATLSPIKSFTLSYTYIGYPFKVADNDKAVMEVNNQNSVVDLNTGSVVFNLSWDDIYSIAPDGSQIIVLNKRYAWNGSTYMPDGGTLFSDPNQADIQHLNADSLVLVSMGALQIIHPVNGTQLLFRNHISANPTYYEHSKHLLGYFAATNFYWMDIRNGIEKSVPADGFNTVFYMVNKYVACEKGFYLELE